MLDLVWLIELELFVTEIETDEEDRLLIDDWLLSDDWLLIDDSELVDDFVAEIEDDDFVIETD